MSRRQCRMFNLLPVIVCCFAVLCASGGSYGSGSGPSGFDDSGSDDSGSGPFDSDDSGSGNSDVAHSGSNQSGSSKSGHVDSGISTSGPGISPSGQVPCLTASCSIKPISWQDPWVIIFISVGAIVLIGGCICCLANVMCKKKKRRGFTLKHLRGITDEPAFAKRLSSTKLDDQIPLDPTDVDRKALDTTSFDMIAEEAHGSTKREADRSISQNSDIVINSNAVAESDEQTADNDHENQTQAMEAKTKPPEESPIPGQTNHSTPITEPTGTEAQPGATGPDRTDADDKDKQAMEKKPSKTTTFKTVPDDAQPSSGTVDNTNKPESTSTSSDTLKKREEGQTSEADESTIHSHATDTPEEDKNTPGKETTSPSNAPEVHEPSTDASDLDTLLLDVMKHMNRGHRTTQAGKNM